MSERNKTKAVVLVNTEVGADEEVFNMLTKIPEVKAVYMVYGLYDIVAVVEGEDKDSIYNIVYKALRSSPKVRSTLTMVVVRDYERR